MRRLLLALALLVTGAGCANVVEVPEDWLEQVDRGWDVEVQTSLNRTLTLYREDGLLTFEERSSTDPLTAFFLVCFILAGAVGLSRKYEQTGRRVAIVGGATLLLALVVFGRSTREVRWDGERSRFVDERGHDLNPFARRRTYDAAGPIEVTNGERCESDDGDRRCWMEVRATTRDWSLIIVSFDTPAFFARASPDALASQERAVARLCAGLLREMNDAPREPSVLDGAPR